jgi:bacteriocin-associated integral membrane protein
MDEISNFATLESQFTHPFVIPEDEALSNSEDVLPILEKSAAKAQVNLFRGARYYRPDRKIEFIKYILLNDQTQFYEYIHLLEGRAISEGETPKGDVFLSNVKTNDKNQIGKIRTFDAKQPFTIKTLQASFDHLPVHGRYYVEVKNDKQLQLFLEVLCEEINTYLKNTTESSLYMASDLQPSEAFIEPSEDFFALTSLSTLETSKNIIFVLTALLLIYYIFSRSKQIGIYKMHGVSNQKIWWIFIGKLLTILTTILALGCLVTTILLQFPVTFLMNSISNLVQAYFILILLSLLCYMYIATIQVSQTIKNKKNTNAVFLLNMGVKVIIAAVLILLSLESFSNFTDLHEQKKRYLFQEGQMNKWEEVDDYGIVEAYLGHTTSYNMEEVEKDLSRSDQALDVLYNTLNDKGALYIDATEYEEEFQKINPNFNGIFSITINPNYLKKYPLYDSRGEQILINEKTEDWVVLVPEQYKYEEDEIRDYYQDTRDYFLKTDKDQKLEIIWMEPGQNIFSMNPDVYPEKNNNILDAVIHVKTVKNDLFTYRGGIRGGGLNDPLKVKLSDNSPEITFEEIKPELERLNLQSSINITSYQNFVSEKLKHMEKEIKSALFIMLGLTGVFLFLTVQNLIIYFDKHCKQFIVKRLFGIGFVRTYQSIFRWFFITSFLFIVISILLDIANVLTPNSLIEGAFIEFLLIVGMLLAIEIVSTIIALFIIERRNKLQVIKAE